MGDDASLDAASFRGNRLRSTPALHAWHDGSRGEQPLEPELPIVDAHHHLYGAPSDTSFYRLEDLAQDLAAGHRIIGTVYVEAYESGWRTSGPAAFRSLGEVELIARTSDEPVRTPHGPCQVAAAIVSNVDLTLGDRAAEVLESHLEAGEGRLRGIRQLALWDDGVVGRFMKGHPRRHLLADPAFRRGLACLSRFGLSFDAGVFHGQLGELRDLADAFPETCIVLNHVGIPLGVAEYAGRRTSVLDEWEKGLRALAARPNVVVKIGGMGMPVLGFGFEHAERPATSEALARAWQPLVDACLEAFGARRCMFESNFPVDKGGYAYAVGWNAMKRIAAGASASEKTDLFWRSAARFYRLPEIA